MNSLQVCVPQIFYIIHLAHVSFTNVLEDFSWILLINPEASTLSFLLETSWLSFNFRLVPDPQFSDSIKKCFGTGGRFKLLKPLVRLRGTHSPWPHLLTTRKTSSQSPFFALSSHFWNFLGGLLCSPRKKKNNYVIIKLLHPHGVYVLSSVSPLRPNYGCMSILILQSNHSGYFSHIFKPALLTGVLEYF